MSSVNLPKALAMATLPSTAITGTINMEEPRSEHISMKLTSLPSGKTVENGGRRNDGRPSLENME